MNTSQHWLADKEYITKTKFSARKFFFRFFLLSLLIVFIFLSFQNPSTARHQIADGDAIRGQASYIELGAGCVASTEWLGYEDYKPEASLISGSFYSDALIEEYPDYDGNKDITAREVEDFFIIDSDLVGDFAIANNLYSKNWTSLPPVWGDYAKQNWEGARIDASYASYLLKKNGMGFADGVRKLYDGSNVVWYHPRLSDVSKSYILEELDRYVTNRIISGKEDFYLQPLPIPEAEYELFPRNIYYTKLGFTQSCLEFDSRVFDTFYEQ